VWGGMVLCNLREVIRLTPFSHNSINTLSCTIKKYIETIVGGTDLVRVGQANSSYSTGQQDEETLLPWLWQMSSSLLGQNQ